MRVKILREVKRNTIIFKNKFMRILNPESQAVNLVDFGQTNIRPGEWIKVRSKDEIRRTLNDRERCKGLRFIDEMYEHCGQTYKVLKVVDYFFNEKRQKMYRPRNTVILDGVVCSGKQLLYKVSCDRNCFFFWSVAWLEKTE